VLVGGLGADTFVFDDRDANNNDGEIPLDRIRDFEFGVDTATFRFDGRWFEDSGLATINNNQGAFSTDDEFLDFLAHVEVRGGEVDVRGSSITAHVVNQANGRELSYRFERLDSSLIDDWNAMA
jgi:hypothetical protein